jgi:carboxymethylenebutenolidase
MVYVTLTGRRGEISVYVGVPDGDGPWPAALVISDARGMTTDLRNEVDWLASIGYLAAAPDLIYQGRTRCLFASMRQALRGEGAVFDDFETVRSWLANHAESTGRVAVAGFCFDGEFALLLAGRGAFDVAGSDYGGLTSGALASLAKTCPVVGKRRLHDTAAKKGPVEVAEVLWAHSIPYDLAPYSASGHSFTNDSLDTGAPRWELILGEMSTSENLGPAAQDTRRRIKSFFDSQMVH